MEVLLLKVFGAAFIFVSVLFVISVFLKRNDIADIAWGTGIMGVSIVSYINAQESNLLLNLLLMMSVLWGVRLTTRIFLRNIKKEEDSRYKKWRDEWGRWFYLRSYFQVYLLQGFLMILVGYSFIHASIYSSNFELNLLTLLGAVVWIIGYVFEVVGDYQLDKFIKSKPQQGEIMDKGLWKYTRHPNYFGEVTMWWGIWIMIFCLPFSYLALISPITITLLILKVSGIPMLEKSFADNPKFQEYKKRTSAFFPLPPKDNI